MVLTTWLTLSIRIPLRCSHAQTVGEPAPLLREIILEQLHDLKEEEFVNTTTPEQKSDSAGIHGKDAAKGTNLSLFAADHAHSHTRTFFSYRGCCKDAD